MHASPVAQSELAPQVHCRVECVAVHWAPGPHSAFDEHPPHFPAEQTWPAAHWLLDVQPGQVDGVQGRQPMMPAHAPPSSTHSQYPASHSLFDEHPWA